jgi:hypothetical protein
MPRYFFNVFDDAKYIADRKGVELADVKEVRSELRRFITLLPERLRRPGVRVAVRDAGGAMVAEEWVMTPIPEDAVVGPVDAASILPRRRRPFWPVN